ncbi:MAG: NAD(P)-dependent oxidoreductase [Pseudomonadota bacterium]
MPVETAKLVSEADVVMICAPHRPQARGLFNAAMLARMKHDAMLVDWARAEYRGTRGSRRRAEGRHHRQVPQLNWATDLPLPKDHPLWDAPNLILAPWGGTGGGAATGCKRAGRSRERNALAGGA